MFTKLSQYKEMANYAAIFFAVLAVLLYFNIHWSAIFTISAIVIYFRLKKKKLIANNQTGYSASAEWQKVVDLYK